MPQQFFGLGHHFRDDCRGRLDLFQGTEAFTHLHDAVHAVRADALLGHFAAGPGGKFVEHFARNAGRAMTRNDILNAVWGNEVFVTPRSIDRCVTTLRSKIEPDPHNPTYVQTVRDVGYRFETEG